jgi:conjugal transfer mating pair stabilization protein TraG
MAGRDDVTNALYGNPSMDPLDRDALIKTIAAEAGNQPPIGQAAVAHVILNRVADGGYGDGIRGVVTAPVKPGSSFHQFSVWNAPGMQDSSKIARTLSSNNPQYAAIGDIVDKVYNGQIPDPTNGATHYFAPASMPGGRPPPWGPLLQQNANRIGDQIFVGGSTGPGQSVPAQITGSLYDQGIGES